MFELYLFSRDRKIIESADRGNISGFVIDWESRGKSRRQTGYDTTISSDSYDDLKTVRGYTDSKIICRINNVPELLDHEVEQAVSLGADEILVPMIRSIEEVSRLLEKIRDRCRLALMVETREAVSLVEQLAEFPIARVFLGLQDLAIDYGYANIFKPLCDYTIDRIRMKIKAPFGFGGATLPHKGHPLPCRLLLSELARLNCTFTFLRRSFLKDVSTAEIPNGIQEIRAMMTELAKLPPAGLEENRKLFVRKIREADQYFDTLNRA